MEAKKEKNIGKEWQDDSIMAWRHFGVDFMADFGIVKIAVLLKLISHRKGAKSAERLGFSLAVARNGKRKGPAARSDQVDLKAVAFSFPLR